MFSQIYCAIAFSSPTTTTTKLFIYIYIQGVAGWHKPGTNLAQSCATLDSDSIESTPWVAQTFRINHLQTARRGLSSRPETYDFEKCATFVPSIMLIPKLVEVHFTISPKTGQIKTWLPRLLPEKLDAAKPGTKKVEAAIKKVESATRKVKAAGQKSGRRKPKE